MVAQVVIALILGRQTIQVAVRNQEDVSPITHNVRVHIHA